jgi:dUTP pyrophosphatase
MSKNNIIIVNIKLFDKSLPHPEYKTEGAAAFDLYAREQTVIPSHSIGYVPLNVALQLPEGYWALMAARSSLHKRGVMMANGIGVGDYDYRGDNDEYRAALYNFTSEDVVIEKAERIVQMIILRRDPVQFEEFDKFDDKSRGGFGSTGRK